MVLGWVDVFILIVILASSVISLSRGFVREVFSLLSWLMAVIVTWMFRDDLAANLTGLFSSPSVRIIVASLILFAVTIMAGEVASKLVIRLVRFTGLAGFDRVLGIAFGCLRGCLLITVVVSIVLHTQLSQEIWWRESALVPYFEATADWLMSVVANQAAAYS